MRLIFPPQFRSVLLLLCLSVLMVSCEDIFPDGKPSIGSFTADPATISSGQSATLSWEDVTDADILSIDPDVGPVSGSSGNVTVSPTVTTTYTLTAANVAGSTTKTVIVTVQGIPQEEPTIGSFSANPTTISSGQTATLSWSSVANADTLSIDPGVGVVSGSSGNVTVSPTATTTYTLTATNDAGSTTDTVTVTVQGIPQEKPSIGSFTVNPATISSGQTATLSWSGVTNADTLSIDPGVGAVTGSSGNRSVSPTATTTYTLTATNNAGSAAKTVTITVEGVPQQKPSIGSFSANPTTITSGQTATLAWSNVTGADTLRIDPGVGPVSGSSGNVSVSPTATATYTLTATNDAGSTTKTATVTVTNDTADAARVSGYIDTLPWGPETLDAAGKREEFVDAVIKACQEFAPPGSDEWQTWCQAFLVAAACRESSLDVEAIDNAADSNPTVGLLQIDLYFAVQDFNNNGPIDAIERVGCEWPDFSNVDWDDGYAWRDWMQDVHCNVGIAAWYYFFSATGNGNPPCYIENYCQGMGTPANLVIGMNSYLMGPAAAAFDPDNPYPNTYVQWIKDWFDDMITPVPEPHPFLRELQPNPPQYCAD